MNNKIGIALIISFILLIGLQKKSIAKSNNFVCLNSSVTYFYDAGYHPCKIDACLATANASSPLTNCSFYLHEGWTVLNDSCGHKETIDGHIINPDSLTIQDQPERAENKSTNDTATFLCVNKFIGPKPSVAWDILESNKNFIGLLHNSDSSISFKPNTLVDINVICHKTCSKSRGYITISSISWITPEGDIITYSEDDLLPCDFTININFRSIIVGILPDPITVSNLKTFNDLFMDLKAKEYKLTIEPVGIDQDAVVKDFNMPNAPDLDAAQITIIDTPSCSYSTARVKWDVDKAVADAYDFKYYYFNPLTNIKYMASNVVNINSDQKHGYIWAMHKTDYRCYYKSETVDVDFPSPIDIDYTRTNVTCHGDNNGSFEITSTSGGTSPYEYECNMGDFDEGTLGKTELRGADYRITITDKNGCSRNQIITIHEPDRLDLAASVITIPTSCTTPDGVINVVAIGGGERWYRYIDFVLYEGEYPDGDRQESVYDTSNSETDTATFGGIKLGNYFVKAFDNCNDSAYVRLEFPFAHVDTINAHTIPAKCKQENGQIVINYFKYGQNFYDVSSSDSALAPFTFILDGKVQTGHSFTYDTLSLKYHISGDSLHYEVWNHTFKIMDSTGCSSDIIKLLLSEPGAIGFHKRSIKESCADKPNGSISISSYYGNRDTTARTFSISPDPNMVGPIVKNSGEVLELNKLPPGTYLITVTDGCTINGTAQDSIMISNYAEVAVASITPVPLSCHNEPSGQLLVSAYGGQPNYNFTLLPDSITLEGIEADIEQSFTGLNHTTSYQIKLDDFNNCTQIFDAPPIPNINPIQITSGIDDITHITCWNGNDGEIPVLADGGNGQISFSLDNINFIDGADNYPGYSYRFTGLSAGENTIYLKDINGCLMDSTYTLIQPVEFRVSSFVTEGIKCYDGSDGEINITANGGTPLGNDYTYNLLNESNIQLDSIIGENGIFTKLPYGNYHVNIFDSKNCLLNSKTKLLTQPTKMAIAKTMTSAICYDSKNISLTADVSGGTGQYTYSWKDINDKVVSNSNTINVNEGNYWVRVIDENNCGYGRSAVGIEPFPLLFVAERPDTLKLFIDNQQDVDFNGLSNGSVSLTSTGGWSFHQYSMDGRHYQNLPEFNGLAIGKYTFYVKDGSNCQNSISTDIIQPDPFFVSINSIKDVDCFGGADGEVVISAVGGVPEAYYFTLDDGKGNIVKQNNTVFNNLPAGNYKLEAGYRRYKEILDNITVGEPVSALSSTISAYQSSRCTLSDGWITASATGGTAPYSYLWNNLQKTATANNLHSGDYFVEVKDNNGCLDTTNTSLWDISGPVLSIAEINPLPCFDSDNVGSATLAVSGGRGPFLVLWDDANLQTGLTASGLAEGQYSAKVTDSDGCISNLEGIDITKPEELLAVFDDFEDPVCYNYANGELSVSAQGGTPPYQFNWQNMGNIGNTGIVTGLEAGKYHLHILDAHSCQAVDSFILKNPDEILIKLPDSILICAGQTTSFDAGNPGMDHQWILNDGTKANQQIINAQTPGKYTITVSNALGCKNSKTLHLKYRTQALDANFLLSSQATMADTIIAIEISWPIPDSLEWSIPKNFEVINELDNYKELLPSKTGTYTIGLRAYKYGCSDYVEKKITVINSGRSNKNGTDEQEDLIKSARLFPNPNSGNFQVEIELSRVADVKADLYNMGGVKIIPTKSAYGENKYLVDFNLMRLVPGIYFVNIEVEKEVRQLKFIVE